MSNNSENVMEKMGNKFFVPLKWDEKADLNELLDYVINLKLNQVSIKNFNNLAMEEASVLADRRIPSVREIIEERVKMVDWLIKICKKFNLKNETLFKGISLLDYYLSRSSRKIMRIEEIQFIAVVCLNIACKFEEINCNYLIFFKDNLLEKGVYELDDMVKKETEILKTLQFKINIPNFYQFNNALMQVAIHKILSSDDWPEPKDTARSQRIFNELLKHNEIITKKFAILKESIFSSALNSGIVCFKMTLISLKLNSGIETSIINDLVDSLFLSKMFKADYIQRCEIVASNLFNVLFSVLKNSVNENSNMNSGGERAPCCISSSISQRDLSCYADKNRKTSEDLGFFNSSSFAANAFAGSNSLQQSYN